MSFSVNNVFPCLSKKLLISLLIKLILFSPNKLFVLISNKVLSSLNKFPVSELNKILFSPNNGNGCLLPNIFISFPNKVL